MFENFSFPSSVATVAGGDSLPPPSPAPTPRPRRQSHSLSLRPSTEPLTPPLSPMHSSGPSPVDSDSCYRYFDSNRDDDPLTATLASFALSKPRYASPDTSDNDEDGGPKSDPFEDVRRKRQSMTRMQTDDDLLRQLGELVKSVTPAGSRKGSAGSLVESSGVAKKRGYSNSVPKIRSRSKPTKSRETKGSGRRVAV